jgi:hypothetical protein
MKIAATFLSADGEQRILIVERDDGTFMLVEQLWYRNIYEDRLIAEGWQSMPSSASFFETAEIAEFEARARFPWLASAQ